MVAFSVAAPALCAAVSSGCTKSGSGLSATGSGGSTTVSITFTANTFYNYLYPVFSIDDKIDPSTGRPTGGPPSFEYETAGGSWTSTTATYDPNVFLGGSVWAAGLPEWTDVPSGAERTISVEIKFNSNMPAGTYDSWFGFVSSEICSSLNISPMPARLSALSYSPAAPVAATTPRASSPASADGSSGTSGSTNSDTGGGASHSPAAGTASGTASSAAKPSPKAPAGASGSPSASAGSSGTDLGTAAAYGAPKPSASSLADLQPTASASSDSTELPWICVFGVAALLALGGGAFTVRRRRLAGARSADGTRGESGSGPENGSEPR